MNMKLTKGLLGLGALLVAGQVNAATVSLTPSVTSVTVNDPFTLTVQGTDFVNDVSSGSVLVSWDATAMTMTSTLADLAASAAANGFPLDFGVNSILPGQLSATYATFGTVAGPTFDFFSMDFVAIPPPSATTLVIDAGLFGDWQDGAGQANITCDLCRCFSKCKSCSSTSCSMVIRQRPDWHGWHCSSS